MDLTIITTYISPIIVLACLVVGFLIKSVATEQVTRFIPIIVAVLGIGANLWATGVVDIYTVVTGAISGLASTGLYEAFANFLKKCGVNCENPAIKEE